MIEKWQELILQGYPEETSRFLASKKDPFANPVGAAIRDELGSVFDGIVADADPAEYGSSLDRIIRVRAVQDFSPAGAVGFVLMLKSLVREFATGTDHHKNLMSFDQSVDRALLAAFDVYSRCREQMFEIRVEAIRNQSIKVVERLNAWRDRRAGEGSVANGEMGDGPALEDDHTSS
jgi:hypothetical protein